MTRNPQRKTFSTLKVTNLLWFNFILGLNFLLCLGMVMYDNDMIMSLKQKKRKFKPRIKLNHNIYTDRDVLREGTKPRGTCLLVAVSSISQISGSGH